MIQPPKLTKLAAASYLSDIDSSIEEWLQQSSKSGHRRYAGPSPAPGGQDQLVTSSTTDQTVPESAGLHREFPAQDFQDQRPASPLKSVHPILEHPRPTTPVPACEELFFADFNLASFDPSEIWVTLDEGTLLVEGEHKMLDQGHYECHEYFRKVALPSAVDTDHIRCTLHRDGHLFVEAPLMKQIGGFNEEDMMEVEAAVRNIPD